MMTFLFNKVLKQAWLIGKLIVACKTNHCIYSINFYSRNNRNEDTACLSIDHVLSDHARSVANIQVIPDDRQRITVRRRLIWDDAKRALARPSFNPFIGLHIDFVGEGAQDAGGPLREFFHFLWSAVSKDGTIFTGSEDKRILTHNVMSLQKGYYFLVGKCVALALVYGGTGPHFFSESVTSYIFNEVLTVASINDIPDELLRVKITKVC